MVPTKQSTTPKSSLRKSLIDSVRLLSAHLGGVIYDEANVRVLTDHGGGKRRAGKRGRSGASSRTFNQEIFEKEFAFAGVERTAAAKARHIPLGRWPWQGSKSDNFVLCRADGAMEQRCYRFHTHPRICDVRGHWRTGTPVRQFNTGPR